MGVNTSASWETEDSRACRCSSEVASVTFATSAVAAAKGVAEPS